MSAPVAPARPAAPASSTPTVRAALRRSVFWVVAGLGALLVAVIAFVITGVAGTSGPPLAADSPNPGGGMAVVEVLRQQGVTVLPVDTLDEAAAAVDADPTATVFVSDASGYLTADRLAELGTLAPHTVVADPDFRLLQALAPEVGFGGVSTADKLTAQCELPAAERAGSISPGGKTLGLPAGSIGYTGCFPGDGSTFSVVERVTDGRTLTLVADTSVFANDEIATFGNAALALNLLGQDDTLVWYLPTLGDVAATGPPSLGDLTPGWVTPVMVLLFVVAMTAMVWRGRRFGPLVAEDLPWWCAPARPWRAAPGSTPGATPGCGRSTRSVSVPSRAWPGPPVCRAPRRWTRWCARLPRSPAATPSACTRCSSATCRPPTRP
ncbi:DUF4350 domain-containing protein [Cryobacterium sp. PAMC25264]|uniref:DUF4350 domain-containing protein n=1 Tax=Cryobacterium sp. PAMC25264 TaxID=2861288 RepID=UPI001C62C343|nr:DUF4350 domain-containing protein [Cryobacterium sp. PAMC25264]QYF73875.1 DUF4350 domain-containing protein [Cryobacterium sp. PAMC25264]